MPDAPVAAMCWLLRCSPMHSAAGANQGLLACSCRAGRHCHLAPSARGWRFADAGVEEFVLQLFAAIAEQSGSGALPQVG